MKIKIICLTLFSRNTNKVSQTVDEVSMKLKDLATAFLPYPRRNEMPSTFSSLDMSMDDAVHVLQNLRNFFEISSHEDQQKLLTMLPSTWGRDRVSTWFSTTEHQARCSLSTKSSSGMFSNTTDHRGHKALYDTIEQLVQNFYTSDDNSRETSNKKEIMYLPPSKTPMPLRFLHLTISETYQKFQQQYSHIKIGRSKFCALRPAWVRAKSTHENCLCLQHANIDLLIQVSGKLLLKSYLFNTLHPRHYRNIFNKNFLYMI